MFENFSLFKRTSELESKIDQFFEKFPPLLVMALIIGVMYLPKSFATTSTISIVALSSVLITSLKNGTTAFIEMQYPDRMYI